MVMSVESLVYISETYEFKEPGEIKNKSSKPHNTGERKSTFCTQLASMNIFKADHFSSGTRYILQRKMKKKQFLLRD